MEVELVFGGTEVAHEVEYHFVDFFGAAVGFVDFVDYDDGFEADLQCFLQDESCLWHGAFEGVDEQYAAVGHVEHALDFATEVGVSRCVDDVDFDVFVSD